MHEDLRRQALESKKTVSRKAASRLASPVTSKPGSRASSRAPSRALSNDASDDEDVAGKTGDEASFRYADLSSLSNAPTNGSLRSMSSLNEILNSTEPEVDAGWRQDLADRIDEVLDAKRNKGSSREKAIATFSHYLMLRYAEDELDGREIALTQSLLKSIKTDSNEKETVLALKALALLTITSPLDTLYGSISSALRLAITDSRSMATKSAAIHTLGISTFYGGASEDEILDNLAYFLEIVASDGNFIGARDESLPVTAALEEWGFLATEISDIDALGYEDALDTLTDQLSSTSADVQIAAGENIALLFEKADENLSSLSDSDSEPESEEDALKGDAEIELATAVKSYLDRKVPLLLPNLQALASLSTPNIGKKARKSLHTAFSSIAFSVQHPWAGPAYSSALKKDSNISHGSRMQLKTEDGSTMVINKWWKLLRLNAYRRILRDGLMVHLGENPAVKDAMPSFGVNAHKVRRQEEEALRRLRKERLANEGF